MSGEQDSESVGVALLDRRQQRAPVSAYAIHKVKRLGVERGKAVVGQGRLYVRQHRPNVDAGRARFNEESGIDGRIEERQLASDTLDILAVP